MTYFDFQLVLNECNPLRVYTLHVDFQHEILTNILSKLFSLYLVSNGSKSIKYNLSSFDLKYSLKYIVVM